MDYATDRKINALIERKGSPEKALAYAKKAAQEIPSRAAYWETVVDEIEFRFPNLA